jgi:hypothetical protein
MNCEERLQRTEVTRILKQAMNYKTYDRRDMGRPRKKWRCMYMRPEQAIA